MSPVHHAHCAMTSNGHGVTITGFYLPYHTLETSPPPPAPGNHLAQEPTPGSAVEFSHPFFYQGIGFFMVLVDVGQLFRCAGHHFMCVATGPPITPLVFICQRG